jgi:hypothetical protein
VKRLVSVASVALVVVAACEGPPPQDPGVVSTKSVAMPCEGGLAVSAGAKRLCVIRQRREYHDAARDCARRGARLAVVDDETTSRALAVAIASPWGYGSGLWLGCTDAEKEGDWQCEGRAMAFTNWAPGQPDNALALDDCLEWLADTGTWNDASCDDKLGWICRGDASLRCGGKKVSANGAVFCAHGETVLDWAGAKAACEKDGGKLASFANDAESRAVFDALKLPAQIPSWQPLEGVWIGLTDEQTEGTFRWANDAPLRFTNWLPAQPDDSGKGEDCVTVTLGDGRWNDADCGRPLPYVCEAR